jgi:hypothetical protein
MTNNISIIKSDINNHDNWRKIEDFISTKIISNSDITFITFCEMYFYKDGKKITNNWVGIIHDPEDTSQYYSNRNLLKNDTFNQSLPYCKGLFCMSHNVKKWVIEQLKPNFFVDTLYHPLSSKNLLEFDIKEYNKNKTIIQIGNWLRRTYSIYKLNTDVKKEVLPSNLRTKKELKYFLRKDKVLLSVEEIKNVIHTPRMSDDDYNKLFHNKVVFLNLYSSTANNVIVECLKANNPIIVNRLPPIENYLGSDYPLFYNNLSEVSELLNNDDLIFNAHLYLKNMNKDKFSMNNMVNTINNNLMKI